MEIKNVVTNIHVLNAAEITTLADPSVVDDIMRNRVL